MWKNACSSIEVCANLQRRPLSCSRFYASSHKPSIKLVSELRKLTDVPISKAKKALEATNYDLEVAQQWVQKDLIDSSARKAPTLQDRITKEGLVGVSVFAPGFETCPGSGIRGAMVEVNCETDFVAKNRLFKSLTSDIAHTVAFISEPTDSKTLFQNCDVERLLDIPFLSPNSPMPIGSSGPISIGNAIRNATMKVGEKITLRRATALVQDPSPTQTSSGLRASSYLHNSAEDSRSTGTIGCMIVLALKSENLRHHMFVDGFMGDLNRLERALARQVVGLGAMHVKPPKGLIDGQVQHHSDALYEQPFVTYPGWLEGNVQTILSQWVRDKGLDVSNGGLEVLEFVKWTVGGL